MLLRGQSDGEFTVKVSRHPVGRQIGEDGCPDYRLIVDVKDLSGNDPVTVTPPRNSKDTELSDVR